MKYESRSRMAELKRMYDAVLAVRPSFEAVIHDCASYADVVRCIEEAYAALQASRVV